MERQGWADAARGLAIITVVFFHVVLGLGDRGPVHWFVWTLISVFGPFPIVLFFIAAGRFSQTLVTGGWSSAVTRRVLGLCYVFALWSLLDAAAVAAVGETKPIDVFAYVVNPRSHLWFIWALALYTAIAATTPRAWRLPVIVGAAVVSLCSFMGVIALDSFVYDNLVRFLPFFMTGVAAGPVEARIEPWRWPVVLLGGCLFAGLTALTIWAPSPLAVKGAFLFGLAILATPVGIAGASIVADAPGLGQPLRTFGRLSLGVYLVHPLVILFLLHLMDATGWSVASDAIAMPFILTILALAMSLGFVLISNRFGWAWLYRPPGVGGARKASAVSTGEARPKQPSV